MTYYVGTMPVGEHLSHHGIKGMKWGQRRYQNPDGSLTAAGRVRYGVSNAYGRARSGIRSAGNRAGRWYRKNKKTIKKVAAVAGTAAAVAGTAYLGKRYGKSAARKAGKAFNVARANFNQKRAQRFARAASRAGYGASIPNKKDWKKIRAINFVNAFKKAKSAVGGAAHKAAGGVGSAVRGAGYHTRRGWAKTKNAARNLGYMAGNVKGNTKRTASKVGTAAKNAAYKAGGTVKNAAKKAPGAAKKYYKKTHGNAFGAAYNAAMGAAYYGHARKGGASRGQAAAVGATRAATGRILPAHAVGIGVRYYNSAKRRKGTNKTTKRRTRK